MVDENDKDSEDESAKFNMAIATLQDLSRNLEEQRLISYSSDLTLAQKQIQRINLVRQFFIRSSPLLPDKVVLKYKNEILRLKPAQRETYDNCSGMSASKFVGYKSVYDETLEYRLDEIMIELQQVLQEEKYFMPPSEEEGMFG